jgi:dTDP-4-amino-4,6-dideoxygalactose transaminase
MGSADEQESARRLRTARQVSALGMMNMIIPFNKAPFIGGEQRHILQSIQSNKMSGDGLFGRRCQAWFEEKLRCKRALLTPSCTHALEMAAMLIDVQPGDEVIMPSYTFSSTANAFVLRGARVVFVDIRPDTMNIDESVIEYAITPNTKAIVPVHYAGVGCEMDVIMDIANHHGLFVIEDAAQGMMSTYKSRPLGGIGHLGAYSFHETKNYTSGGEGGLLIVNDETLVERAEIIREKGTNRSQFFRGMVDKYRWVDIGSSGLMSELQAAYLWGQIEKADDINNHRLAAWRTYHEGLKPLAEKGLIEQPLGPDECGEHNAHIYWIKVSGLDVRTALIEYMKLNGIMAAFHYVPLHTAPAGKRHGLFVGEDLYTSRDSERLVRLPLYFGLTSSEVRYVIAALFAFFGRS